jgi:hypothetical protein
MYSLSVRFESSETNRSVDIELRWRSPFGDELLLPRSSHSRDQKVIGGPASSVMGGNRRGGHVPKQ